MNRSTSNALKILSRLLARDLNAATPCRSNSTSSSLPVNVSRKLLRSHSESRLSLSVHPPGSTARVPSSRWFASSPSTLVSDPVEGDEPVVRLADSCVKRMKKLQSEELNSDVLLRVAVEGGGCSGFQYTFTLDHKANDDDRIFAKDGAKLVVDETSLEYLKGSTVEFSEELIRSAFRVVANPKADHGCSCGSSFSVKI